MLRIGVCGAQSTGKSTLASVLAERLELPLITEKARQVADIMGISSEEMLRREPPERQLEFQRWCLRAQKLAEESHHRDGFVSDRTVVDNAAYWLAWNHAQAGLYSRYHYLVDCYCWAKDYDLIVYCPPSGKEPQDDGFRLPGRVYQKEIDLLIRTLLIGWELPFVRVEGPVEDRVRQVMEALEEGCMVSGKR